MHKPQIWSLFLIPTSLEHFWVIFLRDTWVLCVLLGARNGDFLLFVLLDFNRIPCTILWVKLNPFITYLTPNIMFRHFESCFTLAVSKKRSPGSIYPGCKFQKLASLSIRISKWNFWIVSFHLGMDFTLWGMSHTLGGGSYNLELAIKNLIDRKQIADLNMKSNINYIF